MQPRPTVPRPDDRTELADGLARWIRRAGLASAQSEWTRLEGGRTNFACKVSDGSRRFVCKLYSPDGATPLFPNSAAAESAALRRLRGTGLAPDLVASVETPWGPCLLIEFVDGPAGHVPAGPVVEALRRLHATPPPPRLRRLSIDPDALARSAGPMLRALDAATRRRLETARPATVGTGPAVRPAFLHGDPVPSNILGSSGGVVFIDWQCPAVGDPLHDIATVLSPSMRLADGVAPATDAEVDGVLSRYAEPDLTDRFHRLHPLLTWRFACYAAWKCARGDGDYAVGLAAELSLLEKL